MTAAALLKGKYKKELGMKRFWQYCFTIVAIAALCQTANAQHNEQQEIGSYQSILARAGYSKADANGINTETGGFSQHQQTAQPTAYSNPPPNRQDNTRGNYINQGYDGGCNTPVYSPGAGCDTNFLGQINNLINRNDANWVGGAFGISFRRDYEDNKRLAYNGGNDIYSNDVEHGNFNGQGVSLAKRGCDGSGLEAIFWSLDEEDAYCFAGPTDTYLSGLVDVTHPNAASVWAIYNQGSDARVYRDTDIFNIEFNLLRNGGKYKTRSCRDGNYELYGGFRLFKFDESFRYVSYSNFGAYPDVIEYNLEAENTLLGFQAGGKNEICLTNRIRMSHAGNIGIYNNRVETRQRIFDSNTYSALDYMDTKDDLAMLAQIDVGLIYQLSKKSRCRIGYRAMGVAGVALAIDQIPYDFTDTRALQSANSNGSLLLHGFYFGSEHCF
ncbi:MAG: hypothetical protein ACI87E_001802 [Mariniblastus sp.]